MPTVRNATVVEVARREAKRKRVLESLAHRDVKANFGTGLVKDVVVGKRPSEKNIKTTSIKLAAARWARAKLVAVALHRDLSEIVAEGLDLVEEKYRTELARILQPARKTV